MRIYKCRKSILALTLALLTLVMLVPLRQAEASAYKVSEIDIRIIWDNITDPADIPDSLEIGLMQTDYKGRVNPFRPATLKKSTFGTATVWTGKFPDAIPSATVAGKAYTYSVVWPSANGFTVTGASSVAYNGTAVATYTKGSTIEPSYDIRVEWRNEPSPNTTIRPDSLKVKLLNAKQGNTYEPVTDPAISGDKTVNNDWSGSISGITDVITPGSPVNVQVVNPPSGYVISYAFDGDHTFTITLTYNSDFTGTITWLNAPRFNKPKVTVTIGPENSTTNYITLYIDGRTDDDVLSFSTPVDNPNLTYEIKSVKIVEEVADDLNYNSPSWSGHNITISRKSNPLFRIGVHMRWVDNYNKRERRPIETTIYLYRDGVYTGDAEQISESNGWDAIFYDQPYSDGAHVYQYSVRAHKIPYYWSRCTRLSNFGFLVTQFYGTKSYNSTTTSSAAPKVGDPTLFRTELTDLMRREAASSAAATAALAGATENAETTEAAVVDFDTLKRINKDVVAWISLADSTIDYPIVHGTNNTKYLSRLWSGEANSAGSIFMDYHNNGKFANKNTIVYGHNMQNGTMFHALLSYQNQSFYEANKSISLQTPYGDYSLEPIAGFFTKETYTNVAKRTFNTNAAFLSYVDKCIDSSDFQSETSVVATDKLVTLVTCSDDYGDGTRYLLVCKLTALD